VTVTINLHIINYLFGLNLSDDHMIVCSEELFNMYFERIHQHIIDIERYFENIKGWILKKLSLVGWWEAGERRFTEQITKFRFGFFEPGEDEEMMKAEFRKELTEKYQVPNEDLPTYISNVDRCLNVALLVDVMTDGCSTKHLTLGLTRMRHKYKQAWWEALHSFTLLKHGEFKF
jgi:hypothetical protein